MYRTTIIHSKAPKTKLIHYIKSLLSLTLFKILYRHLHPIHYVWSFRPYKGTSPYNFSYKSLDKYNKNSKSWEPTYIDKTVYYAPVRMSKREAKSLIKKSMITANYITPTPKPDLNFITNNYHKYSPE